MAQVIWHCPEFNPQYFKQTDKQNPEKHKKLQYKIKNEFLKLRNKS
jgi:hypothetical protein